MKYILTAIILIATFAGAQSISPPVIEYKKAAGKAVKGELTISNMSVTALRYSLEGVPFRDSAMQSIHLTLDETSGKLRPKDTRTIGYKIVCDTEPCWLAIIATFTGMHTAEGLAVNLRLDQAVYICANQEHGCREQIRKDVFKIEGK